MQQHHKTRLQLLGGLILFRVVNSLLVRTHFNPDEYWQSLEVAHHMVFGYGHLTWEWDQAIRSFIHPLIFAIPYYLLKIFGLDGQWAIIWVPRIVQGVFAGIGDYYLYLLAEGWIGKVTARWALICQIFSWFTFYCTVRTYSNSLESILTTIALYYWHKESFIDENDDPKNKMTLRDKETNKAISVILVSITFVIRPTTAIVWVFVLFKYLFSIPLQKSIQFITKTALPIAFSVLTISTIIDRIFFGYWAIVPFNFLKVNVLKGVGNFYGTHPFHWYFTQGFPTITLSLLPFIFFGMWKCFNSDSKVKGRMELAWLVIWTLCCYSLLSHKEFRFVLPILPPSFIYAGYFITHYLHNIDELQIQPPHSRSTSHKITTHKSPSKTEAIIVWGLLLTNIPVCAYFSLVHQKAPIDVMSFIRTLPPSSSDNDNHNHNNSFNYNIYFMMNCHATPFYAYVHRTDVKMNFLDCTPNFDDLNSPHESKRFYEDPNLFLEEHFRNQSLPSHIIIKDDTVSPMTAWFEKWGYRECARYNDYNFEGTNFLNYFIVFCKHR